MQHTDVLVSRIEHLESLEIARNHVFSYADAVDSANPEGISELFASDGILSIPSGDIEGRDAIADFYRSRVTGMRRRHFITNVRPLLRSEGNVEVKSYFLFTSQEPDHSVIGWGLYRDVVHIDAGVASLVSKSITPVLGTTIDEGWAL